jgi:FecR-like protein
MAKKIVAFALGLFLSAGVCAGIAHAAGEAVSTMVAVKGKTFIERDSAERPAKVKDDVLLIDTVATREAAKAKMLFVDDSVLTLGEKTKVVVKEYVYSKERGGKSIFNLLDGKMKAVVGKAKFEVHTPTAVAAARGTVFLIETGIRNGVPFTDVISLEGEVVVTPKRDSKVPIGTERGPGSGVATGLTVGAESGSGGQGVVVEPGMAVTSEGKEITIPSAVAPSVLIAFLAATESVSFEMPIPSVAELPAPPAVDGGRASSSRGSSPPAAVASVGDPMDVTGSPFSDVGVPPFTQQPVASTTTQVGVGVNFP